jgi:hypothetical protein
VLGKVAPVLASVTINDLKKDLFAQGSLDQMVQGKWSDLTIEQSFESIIRRADSNH